jgi:hypothetical protein
MDFTTGLGEIESDTYDEPPPKNVWEKFWQWLVRNVELFYLRFDIDACADVNFARLSDV